MYHNSFSVRVPEGSELDGGYVELDHGIQYTLVLRNSRDVRCDVQVEIDGKDVGTFRIDSHSNIQLERPVHDDGRFTFYKAGTEDARKANLDNISRGNLGLIRVTFTPEKKPRKPRVEDKWIAMAATPDYPFSNVSSYTNITRGSSAGGTGLSGQSEQGFYSVAALDYDFSQQTVIHLRLVCRENGPRPLTSYSTPVPPPV